MSGTGTRDFLNLLRVSGRLWGSHGDKLTAAAQGRDPDVDRAAAIQGRRSLTPVEQVRREETPPLVLRQSSRDLLPPPPTLIARQSSRGDPQSPLTITSPTTPLSSTTPGPQVYRPIARYGPPTSLSGTGSPVLTPTSRELSGTPPQAILRQSSSTREGFYTPPTAVGVLSPAQGPSSLRNITGSPVPLPRPSPRPQTSATDAWGMPVKPPLTPTTLNPTQPGSARPTPAYMGDRAPRHFFPNENPKPLAAMVAPIATGTASATGTGDNVPNTKPKVKSPKASSPRSGKKSPRARGRRGSGEKSGSAPASPRGGVSGGSSPAGASPSLDGSASARRRTASAAEPVQQYPQQEQQQKAVVLPSQSSDVETRSANVAAEATTVVVGSRKDSNPEQTRRSSWGAQLMRGLIANSSIMRRRSSASGEGKEIVQVSVATEQVNVTEQLLQLQPGP